MEMTDCHRPITDNYNKLIVPRSVDIVVSKIVAQAEILYKRNFENVYYITLAHLVLTMWSTAQHNLSRR